jgi:hypothetical protein
MAELQGAQSHYGNEESFVNKHSLANLWQDPFLNAEPAVATNVVNCYCLLKSMNTCWRVEVGY